MLQTSSELRAHASGHSIECAKQVSAPVLVHESLDGHPGSLDYRTGHQPGNLDVNEAAMPTKGAAELGLGRTPL